MGADRDVDRTFVACTAQHGRRSSPRSGKRWLTNCHMRTHRAVQRASPLLPVYKNGFANPQTCEGD